MTQSDANHDINGQAILQSIAHAVAKNPTSKDTILLILQHIIDVAFADASIFLLYQDAEILIPCNIIINEDIVKEVADTIRNYIHEWHIGGDIPSIFGASYEGWIVVPVIHDEIAVGALILLFGKTIERDKISRDLLEALIDHLHVVTRLIMLQSKYERHNRNQHEFLRIVTHDMRSPLTSMHGFGSMLESDMVGDLNEKQARFVEKIMSGIAQLALQIDNMQDAGRYDPETGFYEMSRSATDLIDLVQKVVHDSLLPAEKQNLQLSFTADESVPIINIDASMIERSVVNLIDNAIKYTPDGGQVDVFVRHKKDDVVIAVKDTGLGISEENIDQLFKRHFRIRRREHKRVKGSGLGLFIVRSVALKHGGDAWVESRDNEGSTFFIRIPLKGENLLGGG